MKHSIEHCISSDLSSYGLSVLVLYYFIEWIDIEMKFIFFNLTNDYSIGINWLIQLEWIFSSHIN